MGLDVVVEPLTKILLAEEEFFESKEEYEEEVKSVNNLIKLIREKITEQTGQQADWCELWLNELKKESYNERIGTYSTLHYLRFVALYISFYEKMPEYNSEELKELMEYNLDFNFKPNLFLKLVAFLFNKPGKKKENTINTNKKIDKKIFNGKSYDKIIGNESTQDIENHKTAFPHLILHSDCDGYYIPCDFEKPICALEPEKGSTLSIGSTQRLLNELIEFNKYLKLNIDEFEKEINPLNDLDNTDSIDLFEVKWAWYVLYKACLESIELKYPIVFC